MANRIYVIQFENVAVSTIVDFLSLKAGASNGLELRYAQFSALNQSSPSEFRLSLKRYVGATVTQGSGGSTPTINFVDDGDTKASAATAHANDTTIATASTIQTLESYAWNLLLPFEYVPSTEEERGRCQGGEMFAFTLNAAPGTTTSLTGLLRYGERP